MLEERRPNSKAAWRSQEKTVLLWHQGRWLKPHGTTPTTDIFKTRIGTLQNGIDLSNNVENEYYCLKLLGAFSLPVNVAEILEFGATKALVIEHFDRQMAKDGRLLRDPQEDFCQVLSCPPTRKYQNEGGPGMADIRARLRAGDDHRLHHRSGVRRRRRPGLVSSVQGRADQFDRLSGYGGHVLQERVPVR